MKIIKGYEIKPNADLRGADLRGANLYGANLRGANLEFTKGIVSFCLEKHLGILYTYKGSHHIRLGCQDHSVDYWLKEYKAIGKAACYTEYQIETYGMVIKTLSKMEITE